MTEDLNHARWRTSSRSTGQGGQCVEVGPIGTTTAVAVRDSKDRSGGTLVVAPGAWAAFASAVKAGNL